MRIVLDTDVASGLIKRSLPTALMAQVMPHEAALTFVTVGELTRWVHRRDLGARRRSRIDTFLSGRPTLPAGRDVARAWGELMAYADRRGRPRPVNDTWIAASCLTYGLPLATLNLADFDDFVEYEGLRVIAT